ncbi:MAG: hypothetical protein ABIV06_05960 [Thermoanaerobaculia bacterium]
MVHDDAKDAPSANPREGLRAVAHEINGALNTIALNLELLERVAMAGDGAAEGARERYMTHARRGVSAISQIVTLKLLPLAGSGGAPGGGES